MIPVGCKKRSGLDMICNDILRMMIPTCILIVAAVNKYKKGQDGCKNNNKFSL